MDRRDEILEQKYFKYYRPDFPSDERTSEVVKMALSIKEETQAIKNAMDEYAAEWKKKYEEANQFICDLGKLIGLDGLGYDDLKASIEDFRDAIDEKKKDFCLQLLEYMAKNSIECIDSIKGYLFYYRGQYLTKEQLFENFL